MPKEETVQNEFLADPPQSGQMSLGAAAPTVLPGKAFAQEAMAFMRRLLPVAIRGTAASNSLWAASAIARIKSFESLKDGWICEDAVAPRQIDINNALRFVETIQAQTAAAPHHIIPYSAGEISILWRLPNGASTDITFEDGLVIYYCESPNGDLAGEEDIPYSNQIANTLQQFIRANCARVA